MYRYVGVYIYRHIEVQILIQDSPGLQRKSSQRLSWKIVMKTEADRKC